MRLATFNVLHGRSPVDGRVALDRFAAAVAALDADVLALQEVDLGQPRSGRADLTQIAADAMGARDHRFVATLHGPPGVWWSPRRPPTGWAYGIALLSRFPVDEWRVVNLPRRAPLTWVPHARRWTSKLVRDEPRAAIAAVVRCPEGLLTVAGTHVSYLRGWNTHQLALVLDGLRDLPRPLALLGDLNMLPDLAAATTGMRALASALTYPVADPVRQIDHVLAEGALRATAPARSVDTGLSDHRALVVDVTLDG
ncbi:endonuclease/exonuclease/phosphatase family protein [Cellulomonas sp. JH27-2]|uniref:endonuclease/exonuclease/phosphatase family protein n=1 Tax=Cellulomonas sp. JH27-2 TaxID=2774139 RepID=UPI001782EE5B|nr:endonuclease/exonuclease/phosphatase family protein [Cellulomonas sp. JH27-2]MBD8058925.1 endonuclease/exonuclease/phosphatase family protein [Cellulomonas sp. JH27-2]